MLYKRYAVFHFLSWIVGLLINVGTVTPYASVERVDLDLLLGLRAPWLGADVALSIRINRSSYIWVWGDTLVGNLYADGDRNISSMVHDSFSLVSVEDNTTNFYIPNNTLGFLQPHRVSRKFEHTAAAPPANTVLLGRSWNVVAEAGFSLPEDRGSRCCPRF